jgi:hypothetical protein
LPSTVQMTRPRHPLQGKSLPVLGGMRRHGAVELLLVLPWQQVTDPGRLDGRGAIRRGR